ncbi:FitA-like ribbon-helix-helix domain-containing protein [Geminocystis herdmanii]|uniref:FitA-like ribbon-helix-helix domain-containing protein n=1 Tax=Geminocystis herdmanii TaxID=669359 RepID=UPI00034A7F8D|nr:hypothetical protein [Geminocystis herdmanii]
MATIIIENVPDELIAQIQVLAEQNTQSINDKLLSILKQAIEKPRISIKFLSSPEIDRTWENKCKSVPQLQDQIDSISRINPQDYGLPDSTALIREDRER